MHTKLEQIKRGNYMFRREIEKELENYLECKQAIIILGARQVGKTTLLKRLIEKFPKQKTYYFDLETISDKKVLEEGPENFLKYLEFQGLDLNHKNIIFIDEIQYLDDFSKFIKIIVDHYSDSIKLFLSGSSALQIKQGFKDSLAGRKYVFHLFPLTFKEFLRFKGKDLLSDKLISPFYEWKSDELKFSRDELLALIKEFVIFGGYPEVPKINVINQKIKYLFEMVNSYIVKDIRTIFTIEKIDKFNHLIRYLAANFTNLVSINSISNEIGLFKDTIENYVNILEDSFIIKRISPYYKNKSTELKRTQKVFLLDNGIRNALIENFNSLDLRADSGALKENYAFTQLYKAKSEVESLNFWRTVKSQEVDFILTKQSILFPLEVKSSVQKVQKTINHLKLFMNEYNCNRGYLLSFKDEFGIKDNVTILPPYLLN